MSDLEEGLDMAKILLEENIKTINDFPTISEWLQGRCMGMELVISILEDREPDYRRIEK